MPAAPVLFELDSAPLLNRDVPVFAPIPRQQSAWRDLSLIAADAVTHDTLIRVIREANKELVRSALLFDVYRPAVPSADMAGGERSLAVRLELLDDEVTLTDQRIDGVVAQVLQALNERLGVRLRA